MSRGIKKRITRDQWLSAALDLFGKAGEAGLRVEKLASTLGVSKSGFYWHFKDRTDFLSQLLDYWAHEYTEVITQNPLLKMSPPEQRLRMIATLVFEQNLTEFEAAMQVWSNKDPQIDKRLRKVINTRLAFVSQTFEELGFTGGEQTARARMFLGYITSERQIFGANTQASETSREILLQLLTAPIPAP